MVVEWGMLLGAGGFIVALIGGVIARDRQLTNMIHTNHEETAKAIKTGDDQLHERVNRTRDEMSNMYVRRTDLDGHLARIEKAVGELKQDIKEERRETNLRLDAVLQAVSSNNKS